MFTALFVICKQLFFVSEEKLAILLFEFEFCLTENAVLLDSDGLFTKR